MENAEHGDEKKDELENEPKIYGDYEILKPIGRGKFAVVYRAKRISDDKIVALKRISVDMIDEKARDKCLKEVRLLQSLDHPNIIKYYDSFINETDQLIIIVEWAAAGDLKRQLRKAQEKQVGFEERIIWKYFSQIADAIQHMHERRIMHRDLKPANILLTLDGTIKVGDLGLSRELSENTYQAHSKVGTPLYMSPEVLRGDGYDFKSDIWSIGCLLYELAMLKSPFKSEGLNMFSLFQKISQGEYSPLPDRYSDELKNLAYAMISTDPKDRPDIADICDIARSMRVKCNEEYAKGKRFQSSQKLLRETINSSPGEEKEKNLESENALRPTPQNKQDAEDSDENQGENWKSRHNPPLGGSNLSRHDNLPPKISGRQITAQFVTPSFGGDSDDSDATHDRKSKIKSDDQPNTVESNLLIENSKSSLSPRSVRTDRTTIAETNYQKTSPSQKPQFRQRSQVEVKDEDYIPYTSFPSHDQTVPRQSSYSGQPSHRRIKEGGHDQQNFRPETNFHRTCENEPNANVSDSKKSSILENIGVAIALMEEVFSKLTILGYPVSDRSRNVNSLHFVCEFGLLYGNKARGTLRSTQFGSFVNVSLWLMEHSRSEKLIPSIDVDHDAPPVITKYLLNLAQECGVPPSTLAEISPSSLVQGHGEKACNFLNILADQALKFQKHSWRGFVYPNDTESSLHEFVNIESEEVEEMDLSTDLLEREFPLHELSLSANLQRSLIMPNVDPPRWREETERVTPSLQSAMKEKSKRALGWVSNFETLKNYTNQTKSGDGSNEIDISTISLIEMISLLQKNLLENLSGIIRNESLLNSNNNLSSLALEYAGLHEKLKKLEERQKECTKNVSMCSNRLGEIQETLQEATDELVMKTGETDSGDGNTTLINLKRAIKSLKEESRDLHLRTGLLYSELLNIRKSSIREKISHRKSKRRK